MSKYVHDKRYIFIHVPRSGGTSMERVLDIRSGHAKIQEFYEFFNGMSEGLPNFDDIFKFAFVRHPIDRFVSGYFAQNLKGKDISDYILNEDWVDNIYFQPQWKFLSLPASDNLMSFTGRFENLEEDWHIIASTLMVDKKLPHVNRSKKQKYKISDRALGKLKSVYYNDFIHFDYEL